MKPQLRHLLSLLYRYSHAASNPYETVMSLSKEDAELILEAFNARIEFDDPPREAWESAQGSRSQIIRDYLEAK